MSARTPHQRGKLELAGAIADLLAEIERERVGDSPTPVTDDTWAARPLPYQGSGRADRGCR